MARKKGPDMAELQRLTGIADEYREHQGAALLHRFETEEGAKVTQRAGVFSMSLAGVKADHRSGPDGALIAWLGKARRTLRGLV